MDYNRFYKQLFQPIEERIGRVDEASIMAIIGFDGGGPSRMQSARPVVAIGELNRWAEQEAA